MFYIATVEGVIRIPAKFIGEDLDKSVEKILATSYIGNVIKDHGIIIGIKDIIERSEGMVIFEDSAVYVKVKFRAILFKPEINEMTLGIVSGIADFGAFINIGPIDGLVHISQIMDDEVSIGGKDVLVGKNTKKVLKIGDIVKARVVSVSTRDITSMRVALTMKQPGLGKLEWLEEKEVKKKNEKKTKN